MLRNTEHTWGAVTKFLHWSIALLIIAQFVLGWMAESWRLSPTKIELFMWHKSIGMLVLVLVVVRLLWRFASPTPRVPAGTLPWEHVSARGTHLLLYGLMLALPLSGWVINSAAKIPFRVFGWFPLPALVAPDKELAELAEDGHFTLFVILAVVLIVHITAALRHHFVKRNDVLTRMLPVWRLRR